ncbi:hypothetical protein J7T55_002430 [Diaporthe amygdali]|uniref:uncharacterized protein n=1 Tax=Phomopsis amygdali TaxID=1214568 RepID=UPI0022FE37D4|nr:uncharacterized protein J7T55_002430 [Diaporthe amygdali]KAJ0121920.1 hypothetical protein J7T55_002430 [Diaporthe amygdali]
MIRIRPEQPSNSAAKDETRRRAARTEQAIEEKQQDESKHVRSQRLSKWEASTTRPIDEGCELAVSENVVLPSDDCKADLWDAQLAALVSQSLLDDYEAEDADITMDSLRRDEGTYTISYKADRKRKNTNQRRDEMRALDFEDDIDWELVLGSPSEGSISWVMLDE